MRFWCALFFTEISDHVSNCDFGAFSNDSNKHFWCVFFNLIGLWNCMSQIFSNTNQMREYAPKTQFESFENAPKSQFDTWSEISEKNRAHQNCIFEVNQKRDLTSFKHFTAPKINTPGTEFRVSVWRKKKLTSVWLVWKLDLSSVGF